MKKRILIVTVLLILALNAFTQESYPPQGWNADFIDALEQAKEEDKILILNFTGSDWCIWCKRLKEQVFSTDSFKQWADENAVLVFLDFPSSFKLSEEQETQNGYLQQFMGVTGYPTIWVLDNDLTPLLSTGYKEGGVDAYIEHLENDWLQLEDEQKQEMRGNFEIFIEEYLAPLEL